MREQLIQYVNLLFAGVPDCEDMKQEILQNTLDRYDDLIAEGKVPEAAYRLAISGIGDINELLGTAPKNSAAPQSRKPDEADTGRKKLLRAIAVALYILCPVPLLLLGNMGNDWMAIVGLCILLTFVAVATVLMILGAKKEESPECPECPDDRSPDAELRKSISNLIWTVGLVAYFGISFLTGAWYITWLMFPIIGAVQGIVKAIPDLKTTTANAIVRIIIWIVILLILAVILLSFTGHGFYLSTFDNTVYLTEEIDQTQGNESPLTLDPAAVQKLEINWVSGNILLQAADVDAITISESGVSDSANAMYCHQKDGKVTVEFQKNHPVIGSKTSLRKDLTILLPRDWTGQELEVSTASSTLEIRDLTIRGVDLDSADGTCVFTNCRIDDLDIDTASGDVTFSGTLNTLDFDAASASFTADLTNTPSRMEMDTMSGHLDMGLPEDCGYALTMDGLSSRFHSEFEGTFGQKNTYVYGDGRCRINVDGLDCSVEIRKLSPAA